MRNLLRLAIAGALLAASGCKDREGFRPEGIISDVEPGSIAAGRSKRIEIHGDFTRWSAGKLTVSDVHFGDGITVDDLTVANEGFLIVDLTAASDAVPGPRDVEVDGEHAHGAFMVHPPFEVLGSSTIVGGDYTVLDVLGHDTDWLAGRTQVTSSDPDVHLGGDDLFGITGTRVLGPSFLQAIVMGDLFAQTGPRSLTINGITTQDTVPDAITLLAPATSPLAVGNNALSIAGGGSIATKITVPAAPAGTVQSFRAAANTGAPVVALFDADLGMTPIAFFGDTPGVFFLDPSHLAYNFAAGKDLVALVWDASWLADALSGDFHAGANALTYDLLYTPRSGTPLTAGTAKTGETLAQPGDAGLYTISAANRWNLVQVDMTPTVAGSDLDGVVGAVREGFFGAVPVFVPADSTFDGDPETLVYLAGGGLDAFVTVEDFYGASSGASSEFEIVYDEAPLTATGAVSTFHAADDVDVPIPEVGTTQSTLTVAAATTDIADVKVALDIDHTYRGDLFIRLRSPAGTTTTLLFDSFDSAEGIIEAFPVTLHEDGNLGVFNGQDANGTWTLLVEDVLPPDGGVIRGWALAIGGD